MTIGLSPATGELNYGTGNDKHGYKILAAFLCIAIAGFLIRLYNLAAKPFDFDEGLHAYTSFLLLKEGIYVYHPSTHGPFLYHITAASFKLIGDSIFSARLMPAISGGALVLLLFPLRRYFGDVKFLIISGMLAFSYLIITYSRQLRHDIFMIFFILAFIVCIILYFERNSILYLYLGFASLIITTTIKITAYIFMIVLICFFALYYKDTLLHISQQLKSGTEEKSGFKSAHKKSTRRQKKNEHRTKNNKIYYIIFYIVLIFIVINYLFYNNVSDGSIKTISSWLQIVYSKNPDLPQKVSLSPPYYYYLEQLLRFELPIFITGLIGSVYYLRSKKNYFTRFCSFWALSSLFIFSLISYKTPALVLYILLPFIIVSGSFLGDTGEKLFSKNKPVFTIAILTILIVSTSLNNPFAHDTENEYNEISEFIKVNRGNRDIFFLTPTVSAFDVKWPLPWYLREYTLYQIDKADKFIFELKLGLGAKNTSFTENIMLPYETKSIIITSTNTTIPEAAKYGYNRRQFEIADIYY